MDTKMNVIRRVFVSIRLFADSCRWSLRGCHGAAKVGRMSAWHLLKTGHRFGAVEYKQYHYARLAKGEYPATGAGL